MMMAIITYWILNAKLVLIKAMVKTRTKMKISNKRGLNSGKMDCRPSLKPKMYMATAMACEKKNGIPIAPPISSPKDWEIRLNAPPEPIRILVVILDSDKAVDKVIPTATTIINSVPSHSCIPNHPRMPYVHDNSKHRKKGRGEHPCHHTKFFDLFGFFHKG